MKTLLFIYNANSGITNTALDIAHKVFSPKTYNCDLCAITFNTFSENKAWKAFRTNSNIIMEFFHIKEFTKAYPDTKYEYPIILYKTRDELSVLISAKQIKNIVSTDALINEIKKLTT
ncbi:GTPase [uncultured Lacinutrix sp.]|uniref:GTPase n=1 Tax=uncultured Lacinutrix sp. TaxID=574032 RepID=UPI00261972F2|nr:GTPase [uncultured Lacinutrix sp.]